jgi:hypothetical protein
MSTGHGPPPATRGYGVAHVAAPSLSAGHGPLHAARDRGLATAATLGLSTKHGPLYATCGRGPTVTVGLQWTCGPDSSVGSQRQTACSWRRRSQQTQCFAGCA